MKTETSKVSFTFERGVLSFSGVLTSPTIALIEKELARIPTDEIKTVDGSGIENIDTAGAVLINMTTPDDVRFEGFGDKAMRLISLSKDTEVSDAPEKTRKSRLTLEHIGGVFLREIDRINDIAILVVDILFWSVVGLFNRKQYRKGSFTVQAFDMGSTALPIVATILFLVGGIAALQSSTTLRDFGASIFVADMLALGLARELAPLMTAIIVSGRSGSAIASEVATMKFTEELDAIKTMGLNPLRFVVVPKLWAMVVCMPLLSIMALFFGLLGGFIVAITYIDLAPTTFFDRVTMVLMFWDITTGLIKSVSFAVIITVVSTYKGLNFTGGADGVGRATTSAVVASIFSIIVMDSIWGIVFYF